MQNNSISNIPLGFIKATLSTFPISALMPLAKKIYSNEEAVMYYQNKNYPQYYHNEEALRNVFITSFDEKSANYRTIIEKLHLDDMYTEECAQKYINYINEHVQEIANGINKHFHLSKDFIRIKLTHHIQKRLSPLPVHYEWYHDDCPYDHSGYLKQCGFISLNQTVLEFLENEYTGDKEATYESGYGFRYLTYGDLLFYDINELSESILQSYIKNHLEKTFEQTLSDNLFEFIIDECHDEIYNECLAFDFFSWEVAIEFVDLTNISLEKLIYYNRKQKRT